MQDKKPGEHAGSAFEVLAKLCNEAITRHGSDRVAIEKYVADNIGRMSEADRKWFASQIEDLLKFTPPPRRSDARH